MHALKAAKTTNDHLLATQEKLRQGQAIDCLVLADDNPRLLNRLADAMKTVQKQVVAASQERWQAAGEEICEVAEWAVCEAGVDWVVLVGSSDLPGAADQVAADPHDASAVIRTANKRTLDAERRFAERVADFLSTPALTSRIQEGRLRFHCLYYRCESDVFMTFNPEDGEFRELVR